jgi:hypothetical protein
MQRVGRFIGLALCTLVALVAIFATWITVARTGVLNDEKPILTSCSPDGSHCASLVVRSSLRGGGSDVYCLRVKNVTNVTKWSHWADFGKGQPVLFTTETRPTRFVWKNGDHLEVICDACKMNDGDVFWEKTKSGSVIISYMGFVKSID